MKYRSILDSMKMDVLIYDFVVVEAKKAGSISTLRGSLEKLRKFSHVVVVVYASDEDDVDQVMSEANRQISEEILTRTNTPGCTELTCQAGCETGTRHDARQQIHARHSQISRRPRGRVGLLESCQKRTGV